MGERVRPYLFYDIAVSICSTCYRKVEGKTVYRTASSLVSNRRPITSSPCFKICASTPYSL